MQGKKHSLETLIELINICEHGKECKDCCWLWKGSFDTKGYPKVGYHMIYCIASRALYHAIHGIFPKNFILHKCDIKACMNWNHHYEGTREDNTKDALERERYCKGEKHKAHKLTAQQVNEMRKLYETKMYNQKILATMFGIGKSQVSRIVLKKHWSSKNLDT